MPTNQPIRAVTVTTAHNLLEALLFRVFAFGEAIFQTDVRYGLVRVRTYEIVLSD